MPFGDFHEHFESCQIVETIKQLIEKQFTRNNSQNKRNYLAVIKTMSLLIKNLVMSKMKHTENSMNSA